MYLQPFSPPFRSMTWTNTPKVQQGWGSNGGNGSEGWGSGVDGTRTGVSNHWGEPQKGAGSVGWDSDSDRSGSGCWSEPSRTTSSSSTWVGSGGSNTPDQSTPNPSSNWGDPVHKPNQGWGEPGKNHHGAQNWGEANTKPSNEWSKGPESSMSRGNQGSSKPTGGDEEGLSLLELIITELNVFTVKCFEKKKQANARVLFQAGLVAQCLL